MVQPDEGARGGAVRVGQNLGFARRDLEEDPSAADALTYKLDGEGDTEKALAVGRIRTIDPDNPSVTLEWVVAQVKYNQERRGRPIVLVVDSTQTLRTDRDDELEGDRQRITYVMDTLKKATRRFPLTVFNISQLNRSAYRNKKAEDNIHPMAGGAESRAIEFQSDVIVHLDGNIDANVSAQIVKNRGGDRTTWRMLFDRGPAQFREVDEIETENQAERTAEEKHRKHLSALQDRVEVVLKKRGAVSLSTGISTTMLYDSIVGKQSDIKTALLGLAELGVIDSAEGPRRTVLWWRKLGVNAETRMNVGRESLDPDKE